MKIFAHRGARTFEPENSLRAFQKALFDFDADGIEIDVHYSADKQLVVMHDFKLDRTTNGHGPIFKQPLKKLKSLCLKPLSGDDAANETIPTLAEVLDLVSKSGKEINIELKAGSAWYQDIEKQVIKEVYRFGMERNTLISSFDHFAVFKTKEIDPHMPTGVLTGSRMYFPSTYLKTLKANYYNPSFLSLQKEDIDDLHHHRIGIACYAPWTEEQLRAMSEMGCDIVITDRPDLGMQLKNDKKNRDD